jgi:putative DNA methylase
MVENGLTFGVETNAFISCLAAQKNNFPVRVALISTDPPYYNNVAYAELSAFFYVWLRRSQLNTWPDLFRRIGVPKEEELVSAPYRHGTASQSEEFFISGMRRALSAMRQVSAQHTPLAVYYAFKQAEVGEEGITSAGWASFLQAILDSEIAVDGTWPLRTEMSTRMVSQGANALASSIVLICRKRDSASSVVTRADFLRVLKRELPDAIEAIRKAGVGPVDMQQAIIGPGMGVFSRYTRVLEDDDSPMMVRTALALINRVWEEIENELDTTFDPETQVALAWFATYGFEARQSGELITLANAKNIPLNVLFTSGVFQNLHGKAKLIARPDLPKGWRPNTDGASTVWECVQHTARVLRAEKGGAHAAAVLVAEMGPKTEAARALAYRLFEIATKKSWTSEALVYNELAEEWPTLEELAADRTTTRQAVEPDLFAEAR